jgi:hypothetical protein
MRIRGRRLYPSTMAERRLMMRLSGVPIYAPRKTSPYLLARRIERASRTDHPDVLFVREVLRRRKVNAQVPAPPAHEEPSVAASPEQSLPPTEQTDAPDSVTE